LRFGEGHRHELPNLHPAQDSRELGMLITCPSSGNKLSESLANLGCRIAKAKRPFPAFCAPLLNHVKHWRWVRKEHLRCCRDSFAASCLAGKCATADLTVGQPKHAGYEGLGDVRDARCHVDLKKGPPESGLSRGSKCPRRAYDDVSSRLKDTVGRAKKWLMWVPG
jgi:hypothetical protein